MDTEDMDMEGMDEEVMEVITVEDIIKLPSWRWELLVYARREQRCQFEHTKWSSQRTEIMNELQQLVRRQDTHFGWLGLSTFWWKWGGPRKEFIGLQNAIRCMGRDVKYYVKIGW